MTQAMLMQAMVNQVLVCDGAMGTQLMARGLSSGESGELWNVERPGDILAIHQAYLQAGCDIVTTNSFGASRLALERHGLQARTRELNLAGAKLARQAIISSGKMAWALGDVGPFGGFLEPVGEMAADHLKDIFREQCQALREGGADAILVETMVDPAEMVVAVKAACQVADWPVLATFAFNKVDDQASGGFRTIMGTTVEMAMKAAIEAGACVVGANCGTGLSLEDYQRLAEAITAAAGNTPVMIQPNAGAPVMVEGKVVHPATPRDMAAMIPELRNSGVRIIGGCCGTSPSHLQAMAAAIRG